VNLIEYIFVGCVAVIDLHYSWQQLKEFPVVCPSFLCEQIAVVADHFLPQVSVDSPVFLQFTHFMYTMTETLFF